MNVVLFRGISFEVVVENVGESVNQVNGQHFVVEGLRRTLRRRFLKWSWIRARASLGNSNLCPAFQWSERETAQLAGVLWEQTKEIVVRPSRRCQADRFESPLRFALSTPFCFNLGFTSKFIIVDLTQRKEAGVRSGVGRRSVGNQTFGRSVLGCIDAEAWQ